jgi:hypothetical protein
VISHKPTTRIVNLAIPRNIGQHLLRGARQPTLIEEASLLPNRNSIMGDGEGKRVGRTCSTVKGVRL